MKYLLISAYLICFPVCLLGQARSDSINLIEKVYLHTDRDKYSAGDNLYFRAYLIDGIELLLTDHSENLHVELINPDQKIIESETIKLNEGLGSGDFKLASWLPSGTYRVRAYTNYMRNYSTDLLFSKPVSIINLKDTLNSVDSTVYLKRDLLVSFFPEGGSLVEGVESVVGFQAVDATGKSTEIKGTVFSDSGDSVVVFSSRHKGMGSFIFTPVRGQGYKALIRDLSGFSKIVGLPESFKTGLVLNVAGMSNGNIVLKILTNTATLDNIKGKNMSLSLSKGMIPVSTISFTIGSQNNSLSFPASELREGIYMLTLSDPENRPECERLIYIQNNPECIIGIESDRKVYNPRDSVTLKLSFNSDAAYSQMSFLSLSAVDEVSSASESEYTSNIASWFLLESDIHGEVEDPSYYFDQSESDRMKDLDLLLLTQGWRDFRWKYSKTPFKHEHGFSISGRVRKKFEDEGISDALVTISIFRHDKPFIATVNTDSTGHFCIDNVEWVGKATLIASASDAKDNLKGWLILDSIKYFPATVDSNNENNKINLQQEAYIKNDNPVTNPEKNSFIKYSRKNSAILKEYEFTDTIAVGEVTIKGKNIILPEPAKIRSERYLMTLNPDLEYPIDENKAVYNNLGQLLTVRFRMKFSDDPLDNNGLIKLEMSTPGSEYNQGMMTQGFQTNQVPGKESKLNVKNPMLLLNGNKVEFNSIRHIPISWVDRVDVLYPINAELIWGEKNGSHGVVSIILKEDAYIDNFEKSYHSINVKVTGYNEARLFYSPSYNGKEKYDKKPDLRTTYYWSPDLKIEKDKHVFLGFFNSDISSTVRIRVEGITSDGVPLFSTAEYQVR